MRVKIDNIWQKTRKEYADKNSRKVQDTQRECENTLFFLSFYYFLFFAHPKSTSNRNVSGSATSQKRNKQINKKQKLLNAERRTVRRRRFYNTNIKEIAVIQRISSGSSYRNIWKAAGCMEKEGVSLPLPGMLPNHQLSSQTSFSWWDEEWVHSRRPC